ncbi:MAG: hypothetical protein QW429_06995 [Thermoprotei archaeon]
MFKEGVDVFGLCGIGGLQRRIEGLYKEGWRCAVAARVWQTLGVGGSEKI